MPADSPLISDAKKIGQKAEAAALTFWQTRLAFFKTHFLDVAFWLPCAFLIGYWFRALTSL